MQEWPKNSESSFIINILQGLSTGQAVDAEEILNAAKPGLEKLKSNPNYLYGIRAEKMFGYVMAALGECYFIKQEDVGRCYLPHKHKAPDYRIISKSDEKMFVEVKNCNKKINFCCDEDYLRELINYPEVTIDNFRFAIYWNKWRVWTLNSLDVFSKKGNKYHLNLAKALSQCKLFSLGDFYYYFEPPIELIFLFEGLEINTFNNLSDDDLKVQDIEIHTKKGRVKKDTKEFNIIKSLIYDYLHLNAGWGYKTDCITEGNKITKLVVTYTPSKNEEFLAGLVRFSSIIISRYNSETVRDNKIIKINAEYDDGLFNFHQKIEQVQLSHLTIFPGNKNLNHDLN